MMNNAAMRASILIQIVFTIIFAVVEGSINDFIIADESDLKRFEGAETEPINELDEIYDSYSGEHTYDSCYGGNDVDQYLEQYFDEQEEYDATDPLRNVFVDSELRSMMEYDDIGAIFEKLSKHPHYAALIEQAESIKDQRMSPKCQDDYFEDTFLSNHKEVCN